MNAVVYALGAIVAALCALLLLRGFVHTRTRLLLWSGLCFSGLAASNVVLFIDRILLPESTTLYPWRLSLAAASMLLLVYGLIMESER